MCIPMPPLFGDIQKIERVQRTFTSKMKGCENLDYHKRFKHQCLFSSQRRRERYIIIHVWKILNGLSPNDLGLSFSDSKRLGIKANIPSLPRNCKDSAKTLYDSPFVVTGPRLWNSIPESVKCHTQIIRGGGRGAVIITGTRTYYFVD